MTFIGNAEALITEQGLFEGRGPLAILLLVLLGGLALNLTPCVLPMIPINLAIIGAGAPAGSRQRGFLLGLTYGGASLRLRRAELVVVLTASTFGTITPAVVQRGDRRALRGLGPGDVRCVRDRLSRFSSGSAARARRFGLAFMMGAVAALLAGACVAPVAFRWCSREQPLRHGHEPRAGPAVLPGHRHGDRGPSLGPGWCRCPSPGRGWCA